MRDEYSPRRGNPNQPNQGEAGALNAPAYSGQAGAVGNDRAWQGYAHGEPRGEPYNSSYQRDTRGGPSGSTHTYPQTGHTNYGGGVTPNPIYPPGLYQGPWGGVEQNPLWNTAPPPVQPTPNSDYMVWAELIDMRKQMSSMTGRIRDLENENARQRERNNDLVWAVDRVYDLRDRLDAAEARGSIPEKSVRGSMEPGRTTSNKRARHESPERSTGAKAPVEIRSRAGPSNVGPQVSREQLDKGKGPAKAGPSKETPGKSGSQPQEAKSRDPARYAKALKNVLDTAYRWKPAPVPAPFPVDMGGESHWKKIMSSHAFTLSTEKRAYVYALWGHHNPSERDYFIRTLDEAMSDTNDSGNMGTLQQCATLLASWPAVKASHEHKTYFKVAWLVYTSWANPLSKRKQRATKRATTPDEESGDLDIIGGLEFTTLANEIVDIYGSDHPSPTQSYNAWIDYALHQAKRTVLRMVKHGVTFTKSGNSVVPDKENVLVAKQIVLGEYVVHQLRPNTSNALVRRKFIRRARIVCRSMIDVRQRVKELNLNRDVFAVTADTTKYWLAAEVREHPFPMPANGNFSDDAILRHLSEFANPMAIQAMYMLATSVVPRNPPPWVTDASILGAGADTNEELGVDIALREFFDGLETAIFDEGREIPEWERQERAKAAEEAAAALSTGQSGGPEAVAPTSGGGVMEIDLVGPSNKTA